MAIPARAGTCISAVGPRGARHVWLTLDASSWSMTRKHSAMPRPKCFARRASRFPWRPTIGLRSNSREPSTPRSPDHRCGHAGPRKRLCGWLEWHACAAAIRILYVTAYDVPTAEALGKIFRKPIPLDVLVRGRAWRWPPAEIHRRSLPNKRGAGSRNPGRGEGMPPLLRRSANLRNSLSDSDSAEARSGRVNRSTGSTRKSAISVSIAGMRTAFRLRSPPELCFGSAAAGRWPGVNPLSHSVPTKSAGMSIGGGPAWRHPEEGERGAQGIAIGLHGRSGLYRKGENLVEAAARQMVVVIGQCAAGGRPGGQAREAAPSGRRCRDIAPAIPAIPARRHSI